MNGIGCFTRTAPTGFTMWLREHGRVFDWGTLRWCQMQLTNGCYDAETIALDEFGHVEILGHHVNYSDDRDYTDAVVQTVSRSRPRTGYNMHTYGICDTATLQIRYDVTTLSSLYSRCLDIVTVLTLAFSDTSIPYGGLVNVTSLLRAASDTDYGRLSANPIGARTVRPPATRDRFVDLDEPRDADLLAADGHIPGVDPPVWHRRLPGVLRDAVERGAARRHQRDGQGHGRAMHVELPAAHRRAVVGGDWDEATAVGRRGSVAVAGPGSRRVLVGDCAAGAIRPGRDDTDRRPGRVRSADGPSADGEPVRRDVAGADQRSAGGRPVGRGRRPGRRSARHYTWGDGGSDSPWLPGAPISVGTGEPLSLTFDPGVAAESWRARSVPSSAEGPDGASLIGEGAGTPTFTAPRAGSWTVEIRVVFAEGSGDASYFWLLDVS